MATNSAVDEVDSQGSFQLGGNDVYPSTSASEGNASVDMDDTIMVSRSKLTRDFATILFESNNEMQELVSSMGRALQKAEENLKHFEICQQNRLQEFLDESAKRQAARPNGASSVVAPLQFELPESDDQPIKSPLEHGQTSPNSHKSEVSSTGITKRNTVRMQYDGMNRLSARFGKRRSRLAPCYWVQDMIYPCFALLFTVLETKRLNCTSMQYLVNCKEFVTWVCFMIFSNAAFIGYISDVLIEEVHRGTLQPECR